MSILNYMSLIGVGDWSRAMGNSGAQLAPYRAYLTTAKVGAESRPLCLAWRQPTDDELRAIEERRTDHQKRKAQRAATAARRRDRHAPRDLPGGTWVMLESRAGHGEEPDTSFDAFLQARSVYDARPTVDRNRSFWSQDNEIEVRGFDREALALLMSRPPVASEPAEPDPSTPPDGPLLFLRPNTWPLECQRRALEWLENRPTPRISPLLRLASTSPQWPAVAEAAIDEDAWVFLHRDAHGQLRDGTDQQRSFVECALGTPDFAVLEGPPGSGKTTAICELIVQLARAGKRVLLVASTHVAVDNVLERLIAWQDDAREKLVMPIRIGDEDKVTSDVVGAWVLGNLLRTWRGEILDFLDRPVGASPEGTAARQILADALDQQSKSSALADLILDASNLVCGTTIGILQHPGIKAGGATLEPFDYLIIDEASKTTFPEFLVPALYARRWVIVGDRRQLSPYVDDQELAENLDRLLPHEQAQAAVLSFDARRLRPLIAVRSDAEARTIAGEVEARGVEAVNLDEIEPDDLYGVSGTCPKLLWADLVYGKPKTIEAWEHRLPGDLRVVCGPVPELLDWEAHRRALATRMPDQLVSWAKEVAWRQVRAYELRYNPAEQGRLLEELAELRPKTLDDSYFAFRRKRPRLIQGVSQTPQAALDEELSHMRRVAMPSILEILQVGAGSLGWSRETTLTEGLQRALPERMVSLSFQHRMHPDISAFPRDQFYAEAGLLEDASGMASARVWSYRRYVRRALWLDISPRHQRGRGHQRTGNSNPAEADAVMTELREFVGWAATAPRPGSDPKAPWEVAVLTFYRAQEHELRTRLRSLTREYGNSRNFRLPDAKGRVHVTLCTVDRFQGHEADVVFLSFVKSGSVGFLNSPNRLNVALTRARYQVVLIGHRSWMGSERCRSDLLRELAQSPFYAQDIGWEHS